MNSFSINRQITLKDYRQLSFNLTYQRWWVILVNALAIVYIVLLIVTKGTIWDNDNISPFGVAFLAMAISYPIAIVIGVRRNYKSNYRLQESITYDFSNEGYTVTGESCNSKLDWGKVYKVKIVKGWLLLYSNRTVANLIKVKPEDENNIEALKGFLENGNFKAKLKW